MLSRAFQRLFVEPWTRLNERAAQERAANPRFDARVPGALILVALVLVFQEYYGDRPAFDAVFGRFAQSRWYQMGEFAWWSGAKVVGYFIVPAIAVKAMGGRLADYGLTFRGFRKHAWIYVALYAAILPIVIAASYTRPFQATYPFYKLAARSWTDFIAWELMYGATFFALEFFFRGFMLFAVERALGAYGVFVMIVPYCMIHFHKPIAEVTGAIFAGIVLGTLSLWTRSIWCGVLIHISVAWTMDWLALAHVYGLPGSGRVVGY